MRVRPLSLAVLVLATAAAPAAAGPLEPSAPSQLVQLRTFGTACDQFGAIRIDLRTLGDGSTAHNYTLPPKRVLVVRSVRFDAYPGPGTGVFVSLELAGNLIALSGGTGSSNAGIEGGHYQGVFEFDPGLEVSDVSKFCITTQNGGTVNATAVGFLAKAK
jgi:hypothetical protein